VVEKRVDQKDELVKEINIRFILDRTGKSKVE
jgi:hypothetical protein